MHDKKAPLRRSFLRRMMPGIAHAVENLFYESIGTLRKGSKDPDDPSCVSSRTASAAHINWKRAEYPKYERSGVRGPPV